MDAELKRKERILARLEVDDDIADRKRSIAEKKALEAQAKKTYGKDWKQILYGAMKNMKPNADTIHTLYATNPELRQAAVPKMKRYR